MPSILYLGATGYIGSAVFNAIINAHPAFDYSALVRTPSHSSHIHTVNTVIGTLENRDLLIDLAKKADIVVNVARADDVEMIEAVIEGLKRRKDELGKVATLVHTCGGDTFEDRDIWNDMDEDCVASILSKPVERTIARAQQDGILHAYFVAPTIVYGLNPYEKPSPFYLQIIRELLSLPKPKTPPLPFPSLTSSAVQETLDRVIGMVHVKDLASLYLLIVDKILRVQGWTTPVCDDPSSRVYIASAHERTCVMLYNDVVNTLIARKVLHAREESSKERLIDHDGGTSPDKHFFAHRASVELGWEPHKSEWQHDLGWDIDRALEMLKVKQVPQSATTIA
ncbi:hypothetical protein ACEPAI_6616 [Sanghuangporus weigelae]